MSELVELYFYNTLRNLNIVVSNQVGGPNFNTFLIFKGNLNVFFLIFILVLYGRAGFSI